MPRIRSQLPVEIIESDLLPRLPAKSIGRFRSVCKGWNSVLSASEFARSHLRYHTNYKLLLVDQRTFRTVDCDPINHDSVTCSRPIPFKEDVRILASSCDGLLCVALKNTRYLAIWNPLTGGYHKFFISSYHDLLDGAFAFCNDYKLVHVVPREGAYIYSRRLDSWRKIVPSLEISHRISSRFTWSLVCFLGKRVYFNLKSVPRRLWCLISFDLESEKFTEIQPPPSSAPSGASTLCVSLLALNGCIHSCVIYENTTVNFDVWKMDGDHAWIKVAEFSRKHSSLPQTLRHTHVRRDGNWLAISEEDNFNSFKNLDLEDFVTGYMLNSLPWPWRHEHGGAIYMETLMSPNP